MSFKDKLKEYRNKLTPAPWDDSIEIEFIRHDLPPSYNKVQPTQIDREFILFVRNNLDEIIAELEDAV